MPNLNLLDLIVLQGNDRISGLCEDVTVYAPEFSRIPVMRRAGTFYRVAKRVSLPAAGFRRISDGVTPGKSTYRQDLKEMFFLDVPLNIDEAIVLGDDKSSGADIMTSEAAGALQAALIAVGLQTWYGNQADALGFKGMRDQLAGTVAVTTGANTTSAYLVNLGPNGARYDVGNDGEVACLPFMRQQISVPSPGTGSAFYWVTNLRCYIGMSVISNFASYALTGINGALTGSAYTNPWSDFHASRLVASVPAARRPGMLWFANRTAHATLQGSRSAISNFPAGPTGQPAFAPPPTSCEGFDIVVSDCILNTETN